MGGGGHGVPNQSVLAAQSPFNIMPGNYTPLTGRPRSQSTASVSGSQRIIYIMSAPPLIGIAGCTAQGCAFCCQHRRTRLANSAPILSTVPRSGKITSSSAALHGSGQQRCRQVGLRPPRLPPPPQPRCTGCARLAVAALPCSFPCSPSPPRAAPAGGFPCIKRSFKAVPLLKLSCLRASQGAACRLYAARTRRTAARRPASWSPFARCRK
ncbi:hypothetical protein Xind_03906 [Xenorhabdus indica]|nr:hypothetical protein [Xenorhabdus indica]